MSDQIDTTNHFAVGVTGSNAIVILRWRKPMTSDEAINLAAWLVALAPVAEGENAEDKFTTLLAAIHNT